MSKILVTGASGQIGRKTLLHLLKRRPASQLVGLVRDPAKAEDLAQRGIELRQGDYTEPDSLAQAFAGVDKLMLNPTHAFTDRKTSHANVIDAAVDAGIQHILYTPILRKENSGFSMKEITEEDIFTEQKLQSSGLPFTLAKHPPFTDEVISFCIGKDAYEMGVRVPAGEGKFATATRDDLAEAHAVLLTEEGHAGKSYSLIGSPAISFSDLAEILSQIHGKQVPYIPLTEEEFIQLKVAGGLPEFVAQFALGWARGMNRGEWDQASDLESLLGRKPKSTADFFRETYPLL